MRAATATESTLLQSVSPSFLPYYTSTRHVSETDVVLLLELVLVHQQQRYAILKDLLANHRGGGAAAESSSLAKQPL